MRYLIFLAAPLLAQTTISPMQFREWGALTSAPSQIRLYAVDPTKQGVIQVKPGAGLTLRSTPEGWVLDSVSAVPMRLIRRVLTRDAFGNYLAPIGSEIFRNGMLMTAGEDYRRDPEFIVPLPAPWGAEDKVVALYLGAEAVAAVRPSFDALAPKLARLSTR